MVFVLFINVYFFIDVYFFVPQWLKICMGMEVFFYGHASFAAWAWKFLSTGMEILLHGDRFFFLPAKPIQCLRAVSPNYLVGLRLLPMTDLQKSLIFKQSVITA
jgi:hypothetical protein